MKTVISCVFSALILDLILIAPNHPEAINLDALTMVPLELPLILLMLWIVPPSHKWSRLIRVSLVTVLLLTLIGRVADYITYIAFDRSFNSIVDWNLITTGWLTMTASIGWPLTLAGAGVGAITITVLARSMYWAVGVWAALPMPRQLAPAAFIGISFFLAMLVADVGRHRQHWTYNPPGDAFTTRTAVSDAIQWSRTLAGLRSFSQALKDDPYAGQTGLLNLLGHNDVLLIFIESYGRSSFDNPLYAKTHVSTLRAAAQQLEQQGLGMRSGWLQAPMTGGQSWLSHSTIASGLWIENQGLYRMLLRGQRPTLYHYAQNAGFQTMAVMPGIRMDWPEADYFGFDKIFDAHTLGYQGDPFNWVTMPDQFTLSAFEQLERARQDRKPVFAQIALISSHAPWVPIAPVIDWDLVGDGTVFNQWASQGDPPEVVWRDADRVRDQFRQSVDYTLQVVFSYAQRHTKDTPLMIVMGDHEPARFVSQQPGRDIPIHIIGTPEQLSAIEDWQWTSGLVPAAALSVWRMDQFRDQFINAFSESAP